PIINDLRNARKAKALPDSYFFDIEFPRQTPTAVDSLNLPADAFEQRCRRLRHMYQVGLLELLKGKDISLAFKLLQRAGEGLSRLCAKAPLGEFWANVATALRAMQEAQME